MSLLKLEYQLLKKDLWKISLICVILPILNMIIYTKNQVIVPGMPSGEAALLLFGSVDHFILNWIYWVIFCTGYVILLQLIWKTHIHMFEINQLLRHRSPVRFWLVKLVVGFIVTAVYVFCALFVTWIFAAITPTSNNWDPVWLLIFLFLTINIYGHGLIWLAVKNYLMVEVANVLILLLFYTGSRAAAPFIPLYYSMISKQSNPVLTLSVELAVILLLVYLIFKKAKTMDYN